MKACEKCYNQAGKISVTGATLELYENALDKKPEAKIKYKRLCKYCFMEIVLGISWANTESIRDEDFKKG